MQKDPLALPAAASAAIAADARADSPSVTRRGVLVVLLFPAFWLLTSSPA
ncbi:hypothetical protein [Burkholderia ubonensis]|nr:hypothetical protein [Burkholderia ubonensis]